MLGRRAAAAARAAMIIGAIGLMASLTPVHARAACMSPVCFTPGPQTVALTDEIDVNSAGVYQPVAVEKVGAGVYDVAFTLPLTPVPVTYPAGANVPPVDYLATLETPYGAYVGTGAGKWSYALAANPLPNGALTVTAYQVTAGPNNVGISADLKTNTIGFAVAVSNADDMPIGPYHWLQVIADNYNITYNPGYGNAENVLDNGGFATPYYDAVGISTASSFFDAPSRPNAATANESDWWIADLFLATGPGTTGAQNAGPGQVTLFNTGIQYGWANFHIDLGAGQNLKAAFAADTDSIADFDQAFGCSATASCAGLNADLSQSYLNQLDLDFIQMVPEPSAWVLVLAGFALIGGAMRSRRPRTCACRGWSIAF
jgi:hypothetical protein